VNLFCIYKIFFFPPGVFISSSMRKKRSLKYYFSNSSSSSFDILGPLACSHSELIWNYRSYRQPVGLLGRVISPSQGGYLHWKIQTQQKRRLTSMPRVGFEPTIPVSERTKIFRSLDRAATVTGIKLHIETKYGEIHKRQTLYHYTCANASCFLAELCCSLKTETW
jgi:hypothetical protein